MLHAVIMAGGSGTRFWPQSRRDLPKQLLRLAGPDTMVQATVSRIAPVIPAERTWLVTGARLGDETRRQLPQVPAANVLLEPCGRNTAPCVGLAAMHLLARDADATMLVMPADHVIRPAEEFQAAVAHAVGIIDRDPQGVVLFGVKPTYAATGYGYIERHDAEPSRVEGNRSSAGSPPPPPPLPKGGRQSSAATPPASPLQCGDPIGAAGPFRVAKFREKPDAATAEEYVASGRFYWNCGIFVWKARTIVELLERFEPEMTARLRKIGAAVGTPDADAALQAEFPQVKSISIDYAVLEKAANVCVLPATFEWDDVGSWRSLERLLGRDADGNTVDGPFAAINARGCIVRTTTDHVVTAIGVDDLIIVHTPDATLVAKKDDENAVRQLVELLERRGLGRYL